MPEDEVGLRDVAAEDLPIFFDHQRDPDATRMASFAARDADAFAAHWSKILRDPSVIARTILWRGRVAGNIVSFGPDDEPEVGYWIGKEYWGKGIATAALAIFLDIERRRPLFAHVASHNAGSRRVLEKCGFEIAGRVAAPDLVTDGDIEELRLRLDR